MKYSILFCLLIAFLFFSSVGCRRQYPANTPPLERWLTDDTEAAIRYVNKTCTTFYSSKQLDSVMAFYSCMFREFPHKPVGNTDTLIEQIGFALTYFNTAAFYSRKDEAFVSLLDSLYRSGHPFLTDLCQGYLLAYQAYATERFDKEKSKEPALAFAALPPQTNLSQELMCCHLTSWVLWNQGLAADVYIPMQLRAVEAFRKGARLANITSVLSRLSFYYRHSAQYDRAIDYGLQALDWELTHNGGRSNAGTIQMYGDLSDIYHQLFLYDKTFEMLDHAFQSSRAYGNLFMCDLYRKKAYLFETIDEMDSAFYYMDLAIREASIMKDSSYIHACETDRAMFLVENYNQYADSLPRVIKILEQCYADSLQVAPQRRLETRLWYGRALTLTGEVSRGKQLMEQSVDEMKKTQWEQGLYDTYRLLAQFYVEQGMDHELAVLYPTYVAIRDSIEEENRNNASIGANVRYETGRKEQENQVLTTEITLKERTLVYTRVILLLSVFLLAGAACLIVQYRRIRHQERETHFNEMNNLLFAQQELNRRNEALSIELEQTAHTEVIDNVRQQLNPMLLSGHDEVRFRQSFAALHPRYLPRLRACCPEITKSDELVCMLIYLNQNTDEVSLALGISRASVNSARSRIRKKLGMQKEESLDEYLQGIS